MRKNIKSRGKAIVCSITWLPPFFDLYCPTFFSPLASIIVHVCRKQNSLEANPALLQTTSPSFSLKQIDGIINKDLCLGLSVFMAAVKHLGCCWGSQKGLWIRTDRARQNKTLLSWILNDAFPTPISALQISNRTKMEILFIYFYL